jgi:hypothetical protein
MIIGTAPVSMHGKGGELSTGCFLRSLYSRLRSGSRLAVGLSLLFFSVQASDNSAIGTGVAFGQGRSGR